MRRLTEALRERLAGCVRSGAGVENLERDAGGYRVVQSSGEVLTADAVVLATPTFVSADLVKLLAPEASRALQGIPYADVYVFGLGYRRTDVPNALDGFGFLVPRGEGVRVLGVLYSSSLFPDQAPAGRVLLRVIAGGSLDPGFAALSEKEQLSAVRRDLRVTLGVVADPELVERVPWPQGIPQYTLGHSRRVERARGALAAHPGLLLTGNAFDGVGVNDTVRGARETAEKLTEVL